MSEKERLNLLRKLVKPANIYEICMIVISDDEWAASVVFKEGPDRRFRFTRGRLWDEANIGDARAA